MFAFVCVFKSHPKICSLFVSLMLQKIGIFPGLKIRATSWQCCKMRHFVWFSNTVRLLPQAALSPPFFSKALILPRIHSWHVCNYFLHLVNCKENWGFCFKPKYLGGSILNCFRKKWTAAVMKADNMQIFLTKHANFGNLQPSSLFA